MKPGGHDIALTGERGPGRIEDFLRLGKPR